MTNGSHGYPLAQLVDILPTWGWYAVLAGGLLAPLAGLLISLANNTTSRSKGTAVATFYAITLWLAIMAALAPKDDAPLACLFYILTPIGTMLGIWVLAPRRHIATPRGFEVRFKPDNKSG